MMKTTSQKEYKTFLDFILSTKLKAIRVAVIDDDEYFNKMLVQGLTDYSSNMKILYQAKIKIYSFCSATSFIEGFNQGKV